MRFGATLGGGGGIRASTGLAAIVLVAASCSNRDGRKGRDRTDAPALDSADKTVFEDRLASGPLTVLRQGSEVGLLHLSRSLGEQVEFVNCASDENESSRPEALVASSACFRFGYTGSGLHNLRSNGSRFFILQSRADAFNQSSYSVELGLTFDAGRRIALALTSGADLEQRSALSGAEQELLAQARDTLRNLATKMVSWIDRSMPAAENSSCDAHQWCELFMEE